MTYTGLLYLYYYYTMAAKSLKRSYVLEVCVTVLNSQFVHYIIKCPLFLPIPLFCPAH